MENKRRYAALMYEYLDELSELTDEEFGRLCRALLIYSMTGKIPELPDRERLVWKRIQNQEDYHQASYAKVLQSKRDAGRKGAERRWNSNSTTHEMAEDSGAIANDGSAIGAMAEDGADDKNKTNTNTKANRFALERANLARTQGDFVPPTVEEVANYVCQQQSSVNPQRFVDYYAARGWMIGGALMHDWQAALRSWDNRGCGSPKAPEALSAEPTKEDKIAQLKTELDKAVSEQNFERAAELRDQIKGMEA